jgi:hypothetical protein
MSVRDTPIIDSSQEFQNVSPGELQEILNTEFIGYGDASGLFMNPPKTHTHESKVSKLTRQTAHNFSKGFEGHPEVKACSGSSNINILDRCLDTTFEDLKLYIIPPPQAQKNDGDVELNVDGTTAMSTDVYLLLSNASSHNEQTVNGMIDEFFGRALLWSAMNQRVKTIYVYTNAIQIHNVILRDYAVIKVTMDDDQSDFEARKPLNL